MRHALQIGVDEHVGGLVAVHFHGHAQERPSTLIVKHDFHNVVLIVHDWVAVAGAYCF